MRCDLLSILLLSYIIVPADTEHFRDVHGGGRAGAYKEHEKNRLEHPAHVIEAARQLIHIVWKPVKWYWAVRRLVYDTGVICFDLEEEHTQHDCL